MIEVVMCVGVGAGGVNNPANHIVVIWRAWIKPSLWFYLFYVLFVSKDNIYIEFITQFLMKTRKCYGNISHNYEKKPRLRITKERKKERRKKKESASHLPTLRCLTPSPSLLTTPLHSWPNIIGPVWANILPGGTSPVQYLTSEPQIPTFWIHTWISVKWEEWEVRVDNRLTVLLGFCTDIREYCLEMAYQRTRACDIPTRSNIHQCWMKTTFGCTQQTHDVYTTSPQRRCNDDDETTLYKCHVPAG